MMLGIVAANAQGTGTVVVADGTATNSYVPVYGSYTDDFLRCQTIYPESMLTDIAGSEIQGLTYYMSSAASPWSGSFDGTFVIKLGTTTKTAFESGDEWIDVTSFTTVYEGSIDFSASATVVINFGTTYTYTGGNLVIEVGQTSESSGYASTSFYGTSTTGASLQYYNGTSFAQIVGTVRNFMPKTGFIVPVSCVSPTLGTITPEARAAAVAWTENGSATAWQLKLNDGEWLDVTENPYTLTSLTPETAYNLQLRSNCGGGDFSIPVSSSFTTLVSCPAPTALTATAAETSLELTWVENGSATEWLMKVDDGSDQPVTSPYTLTGLTANTAYAIQIRALCGVGDTSSAVSGTFRTLCATQATPYTEGFTDHTSGEAPNCWTTVVASGAYPKIGSTASNATDGNYLELYGSYSGGYVCMVATPTLDRNANTLYLSFDAWLSSYTTDTLYVGLIDNPSDATTFTSVFSLVGTANGGAWTNYEINLSAEATLASSSSKYIAFRFRGSADYCRLDNIVVSEPPACAKPTTLTLNEATDRSLTVLWTEAGSATKWVVKVGDEAWTQTTDNPYTISGLDANTEYAVSVRAFCDPDTSDAISGTFRTLCATQATPYTEGFTDHTSGEAPNCWTTVLANGTYPKIGNNASSATDGNYLELYGSYSNHLCMVATPTLDRNANTLYLSFDAWLSSYTTDTLYVGVIDNPGDPTTFTSVFSLVGTQNGGSWVNYEINLSAESAIASSSSKYIAFRFYGSSDYCRLDNIVVSEPPACAKPIEFTLDAATDNSLTLSWTEAGSATKWVVKVGDGAWTETTENPYTINGLDANTEYAVSVRAFCDPDTSDAISGTFRTLCATQATPYTEGFTDHTSGEAPNCWTTVLANGTYPKIGNNASSATDGNYLELYGSYSNHLCMVATPTLDRNANTLYLSFDAWLSSYTTDTLYVGVIDNPGDPTTFTSVFSLVGTQNGGSWVNYEINLSAESAIASSSSKYIAFRFYGSSDYCRLDNIVVSEPPACAKPIEFTLDAATDNSLTLSWTEAGSATKWVVKVGDGAWTETTENPYTINGLDANTEYAVSVRAFCDPDTSDAVNGTFRTLCGFEAVPYSEDFEGISSGLPGCWEQVASNASRAKWDFTSSGHEGNGLNFNDWYAENSRLIMPVMNCSSLTADGQLSFYFKNPAISNGLFAHLVIYYRTSSTGEWTAIDSWTLTAANEDWTSADVILPSSANAPYYQVSFLATGENTSPRVYLYLDDITIGEAPACARPSNLAAEAAETSLTLSWVENGSATKWVVKVDDGAWTETTQNPYTINDLTANTEYAVSVRAFCDPDTSEAVSGTFRTRCGVFASTDLPYFEGFEGEISCWEQENVTGTTMWETDGLYIYYSATAYEGTSFYGINGDGDETRLISPVFNLTGVDNVTLKFAYIQPEYYGDQDNLTVEYRLSSTSEWQTLATYTDDVATWQSASFDIPNPGATFQFAFRALLEDGYGVGIDSVSLSTESVPQPTCDVPTGLAANNVTANSAVISWTGSAAQYEVEFNGQSSTVATNSYNATGLTAATDYAVRVRALCDGGLTSDWTAMVNFTTLDNGGVDPEPCGVPTNVAVSNVTTNSAVVTWDAPAQEEGFEGDWNLEMGDEDSVHTTITMNSTLHMVLPYVIGHDIDDVDEDVSVAGTQVPVTIEQGAGNQMNISGNFDMMMYGVDEPVTFHFNTTGTVTENGMNIEPANISESVAIMGTMNIDYTGTVSFEQPTELPEDGVLTIGIASMNITGYGDTVIYGQTGTVNISMTASDIEATGMRAGAGNSEPTYEVMITNTASGVENTYASATRTYSAEGLTAATAYTAKVRTVCGEGNYSEWSTAVPFTTLNGDTPVECDVPTNVATSNVTATSVTVSWTGTASEYQIEVSDGGATPITITVSASPYTVEGLTAATNYTVRVRALCEDDETSDWSASASFTTLDGGEPGPQGIDDVNASYSVSVYPNPATNNVTVSVDGLTGKAQVSVIDMSGRTVMTSTMESDATQLNVSKLAQGTYFVRINGETISTVRKLVVK